MTFLKYWLDICYDSRVKWFYKLTLNTCSNETDNILEINGNIGSEFNLYVVIKSESILRCEQGVNFLQSCMKICIFDMLCYVMT